MAFRLKTNHKPAAENSGSLYWPCEGQRWLVTLRIIHFCLILLLNIHYSFLPTDNTHFNIFSKTHEKSNAYWLIVWLQRNKYWEKKCWTFLTSIYKQRKEDTLPSGYSECYISSCPLLTFRQPDCFCELDGSWFSHHLVVGYVKYATLAQRYWDHYCEV